MYIIRYCELCWVNWCHFDGLWIYLNSSKACSSVIFTCTAYYYILYILCASDQKTKYVWTTTSLHVWAMKLLTPTIPPPPRTGELTSDGSVTLIGNNIYISRDPNRRYTRTILPKVIIIHHLYRYLRQILSSSPHITSCLYCKYKYSVTTLYFNTVNVREEANIVFWDTLFEFAGRLTRTISTHSTWSNIMLVYILWMVPNNI